MAPMKAVTDEALNSLNVGSGLVGGDSDISEMNLRPLGLESDGSGEDVEAFDFVDEFAVDLELKGFTGNLDFILIPFSGWLFCRLDLLDAPEVSERLVVFDFLNAFRRSINARSEESPRVSGIFMFELRLHALGHESGWLSSDAQQDAAVARSASGSPAPLESQREILVGLLGEQIAERGPFADEDTLFDAPDILLLDPITDQYVVPSTEIGPIEKRIGSTVFYRLGGSGLGWRKRSGDQEDHRHGE